MASPKPQSYVNHARYVPLFHFGLFGILVLNLAWSIASLIRGVTVATAMGVLMAVAFLGFFFFMRSFATTLQDRIIRLEMRLRLEKILPADLKTRIPELTRDQLIALRFAGDAESVGLVREVLEKKLQGRAEIKSRIRDWQADDLRV